MNKKAQRIRENLALIGMQISNLQKEEESFLYETDSQLIKHTKITIDRQFKPPIKVEEVSFYNHDGLIISELETEYVINGNEKKTKEIQTTYTYTGKTLSSITTISTTYKNNGDIETESTTTTIYS